MGSIIDETEKLKEKLLKKKLLLLIRSETFTNV